MAKGGFKVLINGRIERCHRFSVDFDTGIFINCKGIESCEPELFDRDRFAVMTVTEKDGVDG